MFQKSDDRTPPHQVLSSNNTIFNLCKHAIHIVFGDQHTRHDDCFIAWLGPGAYVVVCQIEFLQRALLKQASQEANIKPMELEVRTIQVKHACVYLRKIMTNCSEFCLPYRTAK